MRTGNLEIWRIALLVADLLSMIRTENETVKLALVSGKLCINTDGGCLFLPLHFIFSPFS